MNLHHISAAVTGMTIAAFFLLFAVSALRERELRAAGISIGVTVAMAASLLIGFMWWQPPDGLLLAATSVIWAVALAYFLPLSRPTPNEPSTVTERVDERDTMFAREEYSAGTARYDEYYAKHPQKKDIDDRLRKLPGLLEHGGRYYVPDRARQIKAVFRSIQALTTQVDGDINAVKESMDPSAATAHVKELVARLGADEVGIARLNRMFVYSHVGRGPEPWGKPIELNHDFAIAFTLEMSYDQVRKAPDLPITEETARQYLRAATISVTLARYLRNLGYPARAHISDSNYQIMLPPVAADAGLGEMSRMGYLISPKYGARVRLGAVTTNLPLIPGQVEPFGVQEFCDVCRKCARNCPSAAIPQGDKTEVRGALMWHLNAEQCLRYWRQVGTDCGLCMRVCPYSHPPTFVHNIVRAGIRHSAFARHVSVWGDDFFYGRRVHLNQW
jgi:ferredoxin